MNPCDWVFSVRMSATNATGQSAQPFQAGDILENAGNMVRVLGNVDPAITGGIPHIKVKIIGLGAGGVGTTYAVEPKQCKLLESA